MLARQMRERNTFIIYGRMYPCDYLQLEIYIYRATHPKNQWKYSAPVGKTIGAV